MAARSGWKVPPVRADARLNVYYHVPVVLASSSRQNQGPELQPHVPLPRSESGAVLLIINLASSRGYPIFPRAYPVLHSYLPFALQVMANCVKRSNAVNAYGPKVTYSVCASRYLSVHRGRSGGWHPVSCLHWCVCRVCCRHSYAAVQGTVHPCRLCPLYSVWLP